MLGGFINTLAGGGSTFTLPALEWAIGSPGAANGTNRIAILLQNVSAVAGFHRGHVVPWRLATRAAIPAVVGGLIGSYAATQLSAGAMRGVLSFAIVVVALTSLFRPTLVPKLDGWKRDVAFLGAGLWLGFLQIGVGFLLLACLAGGLRLDLVRANAAKVLIVLLVTIPVLFIFGGAGQLFWREGLCVAAGNVTGAFVASQLAIKKGTLWVRWVVVVAAVIAIAKLLLFPS